MNYIGWLCGRIYVLTLLFRAHTQFDCFNIYILISCLTKWYKAKHMHTHTNTYKHTHSLTGYAFIRICMIMVMLITFYSVILIFAFVVFILIFGSSPSTIERAFRTIAYQTITNAWKKFKKTEIIIKLLHKTPN